MPPLVSPLRRRVGVAVGVVAVLVLLLLSHGFGRAVPTNNYRPLLTTDAIESGCYPLPGDARLDGLAYQVRWDEDVETPEGKRRHLYGQYDLVDRDEAEGLLIQAFMNVGFREVRSSSELPIGVVSGERLLVKGDVAVGITVTELVDTTADDLVRGDFVLDLPVVAKAKDDPVCDFPSSTKRWPDAGYKRRTPIK
ncbi:MULTISPECIES: hypothetical protein [unclassified Nocardioides]|uniref:hypothetical protein n=1 Tax=unclassified Nocardioides TaxID=2615069 RepID=UPI0006FE1471|nr:MULTISPECIES: hypothetical protein [unclassified Nocardioides]KRA30046.1 hypothetical protein ASD81_20365 [Nocardioides sp. Root614]KRA86966.1 hypothetical protein ASD84_22580 [Nocardioides sp. Root682]